MTATDEIARLRRHLATLGDLHPEPEPVGLDALAAANPELHARVQAVRDANPGLASPPMRATETEPATEGANV